jgi:hypothetical protein
MIKLPVDTHKLYQTRLNALGISSNQIAQGRLILGSTM